jgi:hypothetical protein
MTCRGVPFSAPIASVDEKCLRKVSCIGVPILFLVGRQLHDAIEARKRAPQIELSGALNLFELSLFPLPLPDGRLEHSPPRHLPFH